MGLRRDKNAAKSALEGMLKQMKEDGLSWEFADPGTGDSLSWETRYVPTSVGDDGVKVRRGPDGRIYTLRVVEFEGRWQIECSSDDGKNAITWHRIQEVLAFLHGQESLPFPA